MQCGFPHPASYLTAWRKRRGTDQLESGPILKSTKREKVKEGEALIKSV